jgi:5'-3' exonuclease
MKLHLVDGTYELFRAFFGPPPRTAPDGREVGALVGLLHTLLSLLDDPEVTHVGVAFDHVIESFRNELYAGYKTGDGLPEVLTSQFWPAEDLCRALGLVVWPMIEHEADDALATAAARFRDEVDQVVICSPDKDLAQCVVGDRVVLLDRMRRKLTDEAGVVEKFGVPPASIPDWLGLVGDAADGIPGVPKWGAKSAAAVLARWRHVEAIPASAADWGVAVRGAESLAESLRAHRDEAALWVRLATLSTGARVPESLDDLRWRGADRSLEDVVRGLGEERALARVSRWR